MNCVSPGFIDSGSAPEGELERMVKFIPAGYVGTVDDAVGAVRFLLSDEARYVNGANIQLSGAWGVYIKVESGRMKDKALRWQLQFG